MPVADKVYGGTNGQEQSGRLRRLWPIHLWVGLGLVAVFWPVNWCLPGLRTHWAFFPLWLGYCLTVDGLVALRKGHSLLVRNGRAYVGLFLVSAPAWWLFELFNLRTQNWMYHGVEHFSDLAYFVLCTVSFSTVIPAVFGSAELAGTFGWLRRLGPGPVVVPSRPLLLALFVSGWAMLALLLAWPQYFFPFVWGAVYCILEPINVWRRQPSLLDYTARGDWRPVLALSVGCLICAWFWEMWNYYSYPKWSYQIPYVGFLHLFEMPLFGYLGYPVFAWELYALYHVVAGALGSKGSRSYVEICAEAAPTRPPLPGREPRWAGSEE